MSTEELFMLARERFCVDEAGRFVIPPSGLAMFAEVIRAHTLKELHPFAVGPAEHEAIDRFPAQLEDTLKDRPTAVRVSDRELMEAGGWAEWSPKSLQAARRVEHFVWTVNRLRVPEE